ncbi:MAG: lipopolysaccharide kinase InaA family protein [Phycisphaerae bacterium]|nr:lipopolysaccharide kinase InaA family protein [Phycisphaerae bacterium]
MKHRKIKNSDYRLKLADGFPQNAVFDGRYDAISIDGQRSLFTKLSSSKFANVFKFDLTFKGKVYNLILKQYLNRSFSDILKNHLLPCRAERAFKAGLMLERNGFLSPLMVAVGKKVCMGFMSRNFLVTSEIKNAVSLPKLLEENTPQRHQLIEQFGRTVGIMHGKNIFHGDLRLGNVLVKSMDGKFDFYFLDNERTRKFWKLPYSKRIKNLVQINMLRDGISNADRMRFFREYFKQQHIEMSREELITEIIARTNKRLADKGIISHE